MGARVRCLFAFVVAILGFTLPPILWGAETRAQTTHDIADDLRSLAFLLGDWTADPGQAGETGGFSFKTQVQGRVIVRTNYANYPASGGKPASRHDDLMVIAAEGDSLHADYFDSEGHVIRYVVQSPKAGEALFVSAAKPNEPRYRLRYSLRADGALEGHFDVAAPGAPDLFAPYLTWTAHRSR
jgi:hypothetical protein